MKRESKFLIVLLTVFAALTIQSAHAAASTMTISPSIEWGLRQYGTKITFNEAVTCSSFSYDASSNTKWTWNNMVMDGDTLTNWWLSSQGGNIAINDLFLSKKLSLNASGNPSQSYIISFSDGGKGKPTGITKNGNLVGETAGWTYSGTTVTLTGTFHSSDTWVVSWVEIPSSAPPLISADLSLLQYLLNGDLIGFINAIYISQIGQIFYGLIILMITVPIYIRTQSLGYVSILWLLVGALLETILPIATFNIGWVFIALGLAGILWKLFVASR